MRASRGIRTGAAAATVLGVMTLASCGARSAHDTADDFASAIADGTVSEHPELFEPSPRDAQMAVLDDFHTRCSVDEDSAEVAPGAITPQMRSMAVVVECDGRTMLIGTQVTEPSYGTDESSDFVIEPHFLPGGERDGEFSRSGLPDDIKHLDRVPAAG